MLTRRALLGGASAAVGVSLAGPAVSLGGAGGAAASLDDALAESDLIYLTPLRGDGSESRCKAEIWFVHDGVDVFVVTARDAWRARAVRNGLARARIWVGDLGNWMRSDGAYRNLPQVDAWGEIIQDGDRQARVLALYASKYPLSWLRWGPRFRNGLSDGSRVMLRYDLGAALP